MPDIDNSIYEPFKDEGVLVFGMHRDDPGMVMDFQEQTGVGFPLVEDETYTLGQFAFPPGVGDELNGKTWLTALTTGGSFEAYRSGGFNAFTISELLRPFQRTAELCGMTWLPPFVVHGVLPEGIAGYKSITDEELTGKAREYRTLLEEMEA